MLVKFKTGAAAYGLGYVPGEVAEFKEAKVRILTTLVDEKKNPIGQDWREKKITVEELIEKGVCIQASKEDEEKFVEKQIASEKGGKSGK